MAHTFRLNSESLKRRFAVYVVIAASHHDVKLYVGKTGDNRDGCNPIISRCGNHFSYNTIHSQVRNKIRDHEERTYSYVFEHFDEYHDDPHMRQVAIDRINEMERWLNLEIQDAIRSVKNCELLNPFTARGHVASDERSRRSSFRTPEAREKILEIVTEMKREMANPYKASLGQGRK